MRIELIPKLINVDAWYLRADTNNFWCYQILIPNKDGLSAITAWILMPDVAYFW